jgi:hypothetical protein
VKIKELIRKNSEKKARDTLPPLQKKVLGFFERHKGEVFPQDDPETLRELHDEKDTAIGWSVWALEKKKFLAKLKVGRKTYFGLPVDIKRLEVGLKKAS